MKLLPHWPSARLTRRGPLLPQTSVLRDDGAVFSDPRAQATLLLHLLAPVARAAGNLSLLAAAKKAEAGGDPSVQLATFVLASLLVPPLIEGAAKSQQESWRSAARATYSRAFLRHDHARPALWAMDKDVAHAPGSNQRKDRTYTFAARLRWGVFNEINNACDLSRPALEITVAMVLLSATVGADMAATAALGAALAAGIGMWLLRRAVAREHAISEASGAVRAHLSLFYDNVLIGNANNYQRWRQAMFAANAHQQGLQQQHAKMGALRGLAVLAVAHVPVTLALAHRLTAAQPGELDRNAASNMILQLPYLLAITQRMVASSEVLTRQFLPSRAAMAKTLQEARRAPELDLNEHIRADAVTVRGPHGTSNLTEAFDIMLDAAREGGGRFTLTGDNGTGKSMALLLLKKILAADAAMLIPAELRQLSFGLVEGSTGERVLDALRTAVNEGPQALLLDEWEAHLDGHNRGHFNALLDHLSDSPDMGGKGRLVVEISHQPRASWHTV